MTLASPLPRSDWSAGLAVGAATIAAGVLLGVPLAFQLSGPWGSPGGGLFRTGDFVLGLLRGTLPPVAGWPLRLLIAEAIAGAATVGLAALAAWAASRPVAAIVHAEGPQLREGAGALAGVLKTEQKLSDRLFTAAGIPWCRDRIRRSVLVLGSIGGGKTQMILSFIRGLIESRHRILIVDGPKGDYSQCAPGEPLILAPWHQGPAWDVARDTPTRGHAIALAGALIPDSRDPLWSNASRAVLISALCKLIATRPGAWTWSDLYLEVIADVDRLYEIAKEYYPPAVRLLEDAESKTTGSILMNLAAFLLPVAEMAGAWEKTTERFSFVDWWAGKTGPQIVIIQSSAEFLVLSGAYISAILTRLAMMTASPSYKESLTRKNVLVIDEFAQLPKVAGFEKFIEIGRSKGCSVIVGTQSLAQIRKIWGKDEMAAWLAMIGTKLYVRTAGADDIDMVQREIGSRKVLLPMSSTSISEKAGTATGGSKSRTWQREDRPVVSQENLAALGPVPGKGILAIVQGIGVDPVRLVFPFVSLPRLREPFSENPSFNRIIPTSSATPGGDLAGQEQTTTIEHLAAPSPGAEVSPPVRLVEAVDSAIDDLISETELLESVEVPPPEPRAARRDTEILPSEVAGEVLENVISLATGVDVNVIDVVSKLVEVAPDESPGGTSDSGNSSPKANRRIRLVKKTPLSFE